MKRVFIASPYAGNIHANTERARQLCAWAVRQGVAPIAPHLLYPQFLDEHDEADRARGIACGLALMEACDEMWAYTANGITPGMRAELEHADARGILVKYVGLPKMTGQSARFVIR